ncbi:MAG: hypothetical protein RRA15_09065, partial [bacterium]|nr:hypothetical protein [bacterium]
VEVSDVSGARGRFGEHGLPGWLFSGERLEEDPSPERDPGRFGGKKFIPWLFGFDKLDDKPKLNDNSEDKTERDNSFRP